MLITLHSIVYQDESQLGSTLFYINTLKQTNYQLGVTPNGVIPASGQAEFELSNIRIKLP